MIVVGHLDQISLNVRVDNTAEVDTLYAVVVWYHPDESCIAYAQTLAESIPLIVIDNTESSSDNPKSANQRHDIRSNPNITYIDNEGNQGIAHALNRGLRTVQDLSVLADKSVSSKAQIWCVLFDQDSRVDSSFIQRLDQICQARDEKVAAVAPSYFNQRLKRRGKVISVSPLGIKRLDAKGSSPLVASYVISSGCAIRVAALPNIGLHDESLFIDFVDIEWGFRASAAGYRIEVIPELEMSHQLGDEPIMLFGRRIVNHSPLRHYYYFRNALLLCRRSYIPLVWKLAEVFKLVPRFLLYGLFSDCRWAQIKHILNGVFDGLRGRSGKKEYY
ncbi:glycosyltransferase family 2 protein [Vibrio sp. B1FLJ16]|uniref:glycosyltransferase family 2 protein n=1 Tax=Vibrio sp. B1FLJ16 TaxID=2751178 RepID=UPI0015F63F07|nr:glycosyltransferase family 2 protein [Vibrio sp. B1FLJ16]CAD7807377.1 hypothetical protein ACOMICROBIO_EPCKBFOG_01660 [Vibrio sp. B1FLJ16]CAE6905487.1 hypothetical protein ACOMICROBIO_EPCKBFOG_01660 [Vibrio sp. B1FLJ16]